MTSWRYGASMRAPSSAASTAPSPPSAGSIWPAPTSSSTRLDEPGLDRRPRSPVSSVEALDRAARSRPAPACAVEAVEPERVREEPGSRPLKRSSFASESSRSETRTLIRSRAASSPEASPRTTRAAVVRVVEEVLLGLVEDEVDVASACACSSAVEREPFVDAPAASATASASRGARIVAPAREHDDERLPRGARAASARRRPEAARLADAARPVENGQPRGDEVRDDDLASRARARRRAARRAPSRRTRSGPCTGDAGAPFDRSRRLESPLEQLDVRLAARRRGRRRRSAARTPARAGSASAARPTSDSATGRSPQMRLRISRRFQSAIS